MKTINGKYTEAKVFTDNVEDYALAQIKMICDNVVARDSKICVMPDTHPGKVGPIGITMTFKDIINPNLIGIDVGCGMTIAELKKSKIELQKLDCVIKESIPAGSHIRGDILEDFDLDELYCAKNINKDKALLSLGTLGGGNHFIELDKADDGTQYLIVHSGSRRLGKEITEYYLNLGAKELKANGLDIPYEMTYLEGKLMNDYIHDMLIATTYASKNRNLIIKQIAKKMKFKMVKSYDCIHNYVDIVDEKYLILRKGAISAKEGERVIIPINMKDGVILGIGKGNKEWNCSAPHGSGRIISRSEVKNHHTVSEFKSEMKGIYCSNISKETLDEAPFVYRRIDEIKEAIKDTVEITDILKPVYNFKTGDR